MAEFSPQQQQLLLQAIARGDRQAFEQLYRLTSPRLFAVALRMLRRQVWAEEVLNDSFISVWHHAHSYDPQLSAPITWLTHIVRNRSIDWLRGRDHRESLRMEAFDEQQGEGTAENAEPLWSLQQDNEVQKLAGCVASLPADQRQSIALAYYQGLSHAEVASYLQQPLGTIKSWIRRGLDHLKRCVGL